MNYGEITRWKQAHLAGKKEKIYPYTIANN
jgi:hypothetical protein